MDRSDRWAAAYDTVAARILEILRREFDPVELKLEDQSAQHAGHAGAIGGGGHYRVRLVSARFDGLARMEQHRLVYQVLGEMMGGAIHALSLDTRASSELA